MNKIYIFGIGKGEKYLNRCLIRDNVIINAYIDNYKAETLGVYNGCDIIKQDSINENYDYIIVTLMQYEHVREMLLEKGIERNKIICFFDFNDVVKEQLWDIIDSYKWKVELLFKQQTELIKPSIDNLQYELYYDSDEIIRDCPKIIDVDQTIRIIKEQKKSLTRFGDGEFELMCGRFRADFQEVNGMLANKLMEALNSKEDNLLIAIADNYGRLDKYTDDGARDIRMYLTSSVRKNHMSLLDLNRTYYDAYLSRPYIIYRDKEKAKKRIQNIKEMWNNIDVLIVEGEHTRFGVGNDLLANAKGVERIICPDKNAFNKYDIIKEETLKYGKNKLILTILGPTATVLAYDVAKEKEYWIVDIGQLDTEYEWSLRGVSERCNIENKNVSEVISYVPIEDRNDESMKEYEKQIIYKVN